jgi:hypothetical protein
MEGASLEDGTLNRFLLLSGRASVEDRDPDYDHSEVPEFISDALRSIYFRSGEMATTFRNDSSVDPSAQAKVRQLPWCADGSHKRYKAFSAEVERIISSDPNRGAFYARTTEMALRIATIVAIGRMDDDQVRLSDLEYGIALARQSARFMSAGAGDYMSDNENQANAQKIVRCIRARGGRASYRELLRSLQNSIRVRDLKDLLVALCDAGTLERQELPNKSGPPTFWYQVKEQA